VTNPNQKFTRRKFIRGTGVVVGAFGLSRAPKATAKEYADPSDEYPWTVDVSRNAQATMYLLMGLNLAEILLDPFKDVLQHMADEALDAQNANSGSRSRQASMLSLAINKPDEPMVKLSHLHQALIDAVNAIPNADSALSYREYASLDHTDSKWIAVEPSLTALEDYISVPLLHTVPAQIAQYFLGDSDAISDINHHGRKPGWSGRKLNELFDKPKDSIDHSGGSIKSERARWVELKKTGLLWCFPINDGEGTWRPATGNGKRCQDGICVTSSNTNDYCQMVDGQCNTMSG